MVAAPMRKIGLPLCQLSHELSQKPTKENCLCDFESDATLICNGCHQRRIRREFIASFPCEGRMHVRSKGYRRPLVTPILPSAGKIVKTKHLCDKCGHITNIGWNRREHVEQTYKAPVPIKCHNCDTVVTKANLNEHQRLVCMQNCHLSCSRLHNDLKFRSIGAHHKISHTQINQMQGFANTAVLIIEEGEKHCEYRRLEAELEPVTSMISRRNFRTSFPISLPAPVTVSESLGLSNDDGDFWIGLPGPIPLSLGPSPLSALHGYNEAKDVFEKGKNRRQMT